MKTLSHFKRDNSATDYTIFHPSKATCAGGRENSVALWALCMSRLCLKVLKRLLCRMSGIAFELELSAWTARHAAAVIPFSTITVIRQNDSEADD